LAVRAGEGTAAELLLLHELRGGDSVTRVWQWCSNGVTMVSQLYPKCVAVVVSQWCPYLLLGRELGRELLLGNGHSGESRGKHARLHLI
jgi:hypothetical protein